MCRTREAIFGFNFTAWFYIGFKILLKCLLCCDENIKQQFVLNRYNQEYGISGWFDNYIYLINLSTLKQNNNRYNHIKMHIKYNWWKRLFFKGTNTNCSLFVDI